MKLRYLVLGAGLLVSAWLAVFGDKEAVGTAQPVARPVVGNAAVAALPRQREAAVRVSAALPVAILEVARREDAGDSGAPSRLFSAQRWNPPAVPAAKAASAAPAGPAAAPPAAPPLPFIYLGKKGQDGVWEVYLAWRDQSVVARVHAVLAGAYRVESITATSMAFTYLPLNEVQRLSLGPND